MNYKIANFALVLLAGLFLGCKSYQKPQGLIVVTASPREGGNVTGGGDYDPRDRVVISATPNTGWGFIEWNDNVTNLSRTVVANRGTKTYTAYFSTNVPPTYGNLVLSAEPPNGGTVAGAGTYQVGQSVQITATPSAHWTFDHWQDAVQNNPRFVTVPNGTLIMAATFVTNAVVYADLIASPSPPQGGSINGMGSFPVGSSHTLTAVPASGWRFTSWQDGLTESARAVVVPTGGYTYTAYFQQFGTVTLVSEPINGGSTSGAGTYTAGQGITITATPAANWKFIRWQDGDQNASRSITVPGGAVTYTATFATNAPPPATDGSATLDWPPSSGATSYNVRWGTTSGSYTGLLATSGTTVKVPGLKTNLTYFFAVMSVGSSGQISQPSCEVAWRWGQTNECGL